ncbi:hypothetical protein THMIRHAS_24840 [Thiosulfatimonas sediminis]|uniref:Lipoprotein n=1 Tax=Thiosulfatimonas sediminis TaxID=2675054 RepID=A0A6F8PYB3_9GAMM|nr:hypothetical protein [Thiosulfatimonas sediminis]BBP47111.1 hypothetical protein THMIRHAS_24840 [Thiosulfatimonas sediminis]
MKTQRLFSPLLTTTLATASAVLLLNACSLTPPKHMMDIQQGEHFNLQQSLSIPAGSARVYIQNGQITGYGFDRFEPHCRLEVKTLREQATLIQADQFKITAVRIGEEAVAERTTQSVPQMLANFGLQPAMASDSDKDSNRTPTMDYVHLYLQSANQPDVLRLTCAGALSDGDPFDAPRSHRPQREKIKEILGKIAQID